MSAPDEYRLLVVRRSPVKEREDIIPTLDWLVAALTKEDPALFTWFGRSPAKEEVALFDGEKSRMPGFVAVSDIDYGFGRKPHQPTNSVALYNPYQDDKSVYLRVKFVCDGEESTGPGVHVELRMGREAVGPPTDERGEKIEKLFGYLLAAVRPDYGHVELPGHPEDDDFPMTFDVGWETFLSHRELAVPPAIPSPAVVVPGDQGTRFYATQKLGVQTYGDLAREIKAVRDVLKSKPGPPGTGGSGPPPGPKPPPLVQKPSFMLDPNAEPLKAPASKAEVAAPHLPPVAAPASVPKPASGAQVIMDEGDTMDLDANQMRRLQEATPFEHKDPDDPSKKD